MAHFMSRVQIHCSVQERFRGFGRTDELVGVRAWSASHVCRSRVVLSRQECFKECHFSGKSLWMCCHGYQVHIYSFLKFLLRCSLKSVETSSHVTKVSGGHQQELSDPLNVVVTGTPLFSILPTNKS